MRTGWQECVSAFRPTASARQLSIDTTAYRSVTMWTVLELVISDDLSPPLQCPLCGWLCVHCSIQIPSEQATCPACGGSFRLSDLALKNDKTHSIPSGLSVSDHGSSWTIEISTRSLRVVLVTLISGVGLLGGAVFDLMHSISLFDGKTSDDPVDSLLRLLVPVLLASSAALLGCAAYWCWGRYVVSASGAVGSIFKGLGRIGKEQIFRLPVINGVCLTKVASEDHRGNQIARSVIRLEGVDFYVDFGQDLPDEQRTYIALFLLQKRTEYTT